MADDLAVRYALAEVLDMDRLEHLVHRAEAAPEDHPGGLDLFRRIAAERLGEIPDNHLVQANTHVLRGVAAEMLVREEQHFLATRERPYPPGPSLSRREIGKAA